MVITIITNSKKPAKVNGAKPTNPTNGTTSTKLMTCGTKEPTTQEIATVNNALKTVSLGDVNIESGLTIFTWIHVINKGNTGFLSQNQIFNQIDALNNRYASIGVSFVLSGWENYPNDLWYDFTVDNQGEFTVYAQEMKQSLRRGDRSMLNIYIVNFFNAPNLAGKATFPWDNSDVDFSQDGVVVSNTVIVGGSNSKYNLGMTLVHEVGHWLGLFHTFQGACGSQPLMSGDFVADTPAEAYPGIFGPDGGDCPIGRDSCPNLPGTDVSTLSLGLSLCLHKILL
jgi:hypothetical protein